MAAATEHHEQVALFRWARFAAAGRPELRLLHAIPNGGHRHKAVAARMKAEGVRSGVPDVFLPVPRGGFAGLYVEMKTRRGRVSEEQRRWIDALCAQGYRAEVCRDWNAARQLIEDYLGGGDSGPWQPGTSDVPRNEGREHDGHA